MKSLSSSVLDLDPKLYRIVLISSLMLFISSSILYSISFDWPNNTWIYALWVAGMSFVAFFVTLILRFHGIFEWLIDITVTTLVIAHLMTVMQVSLAEYILFLPGIGHLFAIVILTGGWVILYPYFMYRIYRRFRKVRNNVN